MNNKKIHTINGCYITKINFFPTNWRTCSKKLLEKTWYISYYFHDPAFPNYEKGVRKLKKGMNEYETLVERREATEIVYETLMNSLVHQNYNPITDVFMKKEESIGLIDEDSTIIEMLKYAIKIKKCSQGYKTNLNSLVNRTEESLILLGYQYLNINDLTRKHIKAILRDFQTRYNIENKKYNKSKAMLSSLFSELIEEELAENNPTQNIKKLPEKQSIREILTNEDRKRVYIHLKENHYFFWRFMMIYYSSGARIAELLKMKVSDVNLKEKEFKVIVEKGGRKKEVIKPINNNELHLWKEVINEQNTDRIIVNSNHYLFSRGLQKGENPIRREQITRRWKTHVKDKLEITADFASLTHLYADNIAAELDLKHAQKLRSHTTDRMMKKHYAINEDQRQLERLKNINIPFVVGE